MNLDDFSFQEDDQRYINPQVSLDEQNAFIKSLRETQGARNEEIKQDTYNLGTQVPSNLGGLVGGESYFNARYQTPQTNALVADLRSAAQAQALNEAMSNEIAKAKRKYNLAARAARKRANTVYPTSPYSPDTPDTNPDVSYEDSSEDVVNPEKAMSEYTPPKEGSDRWKELYDKNNNGIDDRFESTYEYQHKNQGGVDSLLSPGQSYINQGIQSGL